MTRLAPKGCLFNLLAVVTCLILFGLAGAVIDQYKYATKSNWGKLYGNTDWDEVIKLIPRYARDWLAKNPHPD